MRDDWALNWMIKFRWRYTAALLVKDRFMKNAPAEERITSGHYLFKEKWDPFGTASLLIKCKPVTIASIFNEWFSNKKLHDGPPPPVPIRPIIITDILLTAPPFKDQVDKVYQAVDLLAWSNADLIKKLFTDASHPAAIKILEGTKAPPINTHFKFVDFNIMVFLLAQLKMKNADMFAMRFSKLPPSLAQQVAQQLMMMQKLKIYEKANMVIDRLTAKEPAGPPPRPQLPPEPKPGDGKDKTADNAKQ
jgi:hypothetical protein